MQIPGDYQRAGKRSLLGAVMLALGAVLGFGTGFWARGRQWGCVVLGLLAIAAAALYAAYLMWGQTYG